MKFNLYNLILTGENFRHHLKTSDPSPRDLTGMLMLFSGHLIDQWLIFSCLLIFNLEHNLKHGDAAGYGGNHFLSTENPWTTLKLPEKPKSSFTEKATVVLTKFLLQAISHLCAHLVPIISWIILIVPSKYACFARLSRLPRRQYLSCSSFLYLRPPAWASQMSANTSLLVLFATLYCVCEPADPPSLVYQTCLLFCSLFISS